MPAKLKLILLVDDNEDDNFFHRRIIDKANIVESVDVCVDGNDALMYLQRQGKYKERSEVYIPPDLILLDINMPRTNGWEFLETYQSMDRQFVGGPVVIMLTTSLNAADRERAEGCPLVREFGPKPLRQRTLLEIIAKHFPDAGPSQLN